MALALGLGSAYLYTNILYIFTITPRISIQSFWSPQCIVHPWHKAWLHQIYHCTWCSSWRRALHLLWPESLVLQCETRSDERKCCGTRWWLGWIDGCRRRDRGSTSRYNKSIYWWSARRDHSWRWPSFYAIQASTGRRGPPVNSNR